MMAVGKRIKQYRESKGMSQKKVAEYVGVSQAMLCQIERGTKNPSLQLAYDIAELLECKVEDFMVG